MPDEIEQNMHANFMFVAFRDRLRKTLQPPCTPTLA